MSARHQRSPESEREAIAEQASLWLAKRDRGLTPAEQDEYLRWLGADPRHAEAVQQHAAALERMMQLYEWQPGQSADANPDLFAPAKPRSRWLGWVTGLAAAAVLSVGIFVWPEHPVPATPGHASVAVLRVSDQQVLPDGSVVALKDGSRLSVAFTGGERRVRLTGEAHFTVAKSAVPFVVEAGAVAVRAVGTAFNVRTLLGEVDVLVTEGRVAVATARTEETGLDTGRVEASVTHETFLEAGEQAIVTPNAETEVRRVTMEQIEEVLAWKATRLQFVETPLAVAVAEFNRRNHVRLVLGQQELADIPIGGTFRVDNLEGFVRLLDITLDIRAARRGEQEIVLTRGR
jgi:transmembrane sensor